MRRAAKVDGNQNAIVSDLRKLGCSVAITSALGKGFPDIVVGLRGRNYLFEIKDPAQPPSKQRLTPDERDFAGDWFGQYSVITSVEDVFKSIALWSSDAPR